MSKYIVLHGIHIAKDFIPETFGPLATIGPKFRMGYGKQGNSRDYQVCECRCGTIRVVKTCELKARKSSLCTCKSAFRNDIGSVKHGATNSCEYNTWKQLQKRCYNAQNKDFHDYGGRGITVCDRWREPNGQGFLNFYADMGPRPEGAYSIERKLVNGNYCPENCVWDTMDNQQRNKRSTKRVMLNDTVKCVAELASIYGLHRNTLCSRLKSGWDVEKALTTKTKRKQ